MLKKVLIANRGEIALRIVRACNELGIQSVAIYSDADRYALHVKRATEAFCLGPDPLSAYLNIHHIIDIAKQSKAEAIHPGYGFLSENADFAQACVDAGITFIGPSPEIIETMGSKIKAREAMSTAGVPIIPGSKGDLKNIDEAIKLAKTIGYPVMLKATYGGGGRGIRLCQNEVELKNAYPRVISEATKYFSNGALFMEKVIENPRHIEVQILADNFGKVIHLFERDCSIQRRHQKLVECAPSPKLSETKRQEITDFAIKAAQAVNYTNAGTVEFMLDKNDNAYFLEMNTRLQVEHPITEQITGIDIVQQQLLIASQKPLAIQQSHVQKRGFAVEFRINAEDPKNDFLPSFGKITRYYAPGGPGVRTDSAIYTGYTIPPNYDSLCAKLTVWALDWPTLINRAARALDEMRLYGVKTTIPYYLEILKTRDFRRGEFDTGFVLSHPTLVNYSEKALPQYKALALAAAVTAFSSE
jgi:pyruvate carboxylase subunit A